MVQQWEQPPAPVGWGCLRCQDERVNWELGESISNATSGHNANGRTPWPLHYLVRLVINSWATSPPAHRSRHWKQTLQRHRHATQPCFCVALIFSMRPACPSPDIVHPSPEIRGRFILQSASAKVARAGITYQPCSVDWPKRRFPASRPGWALFASVGCGRFHRSLRQHPE